MAEPRRSVTISGAAGAWGDSSLSTAQLLSDARSDYIIYEGLAEITMAILSRAAAKDPSKGYATDLIEAIASNLEGFISNGVRVVTNAGGVNPGAAARRIREAADVAGLSVSVAVVTGDDLKRTRHDRGRALSVNAYLGARPISAAFGAGADVVVTGRVADSALVLGPLLHEFGWEEPDLLSAGSLAGHLLECGPQSTGGLLTDWEDTVSWVNPGYPIAEVRRDGTFVLTASADSDAIVDERTVTEQLLYEIGDPAAYVLPDVVCDWREVAVESLGKNRALISGARGRPPTPTLKACAQLVDGWRVQSLLFVGGRDAVAKAERAGRDLIERGRSMLAAAGLSDFESTSVEVLGGEATYGPHSRATDAREVVLKIGVRHESREALARFVREIPSLGLGGPPGVTGGGAGLPSPSPLIQLDCFLIPRDEVTARVEVDGVEVEFAETTTGVPLSASERVVQVEGPFTSGETVEGPLIWIAHGRSGDKGADVNIGIRARHADFLPVLRSQLTEDVVAAWLAHLDATGVVRYELPGIQAFNFVLEGGLGAGGTASLRFDPQGKAIAQQLLDMPISIPVELIDHPAVRRP